MKSNPPLIMLRRAILVLVAAIPLLLTACAGAEPRPLPTATATGAKAWSGPIALKTATGISLPNSCAVSQAWQVRPDIAPGIGNGMVWMISPPVRPASALDSPAKTIWLIDQQITGTVRISGERLEDGAPALFSYDEVPGLEFAKPGDSADAVNAMNQRNMQRLLAHRTTQAIFEGPHGSENDRRGYVFYNGPGCWRFTIETQRGAFQIVQYLQA